MLFSPLPVSTERSFTVQNINRDLASTNKIQAKLIAVILHELRNPLSTIALSAEILEGEVADDQKQKHLERIQSKVKQMTHLLENLTLLLYGNSEELKPNLECVDLIQLCTELIEEIEFSTHRHHFTISYRNQDRSDKNYNKNHNKNYSWANAWIDQSLIARSLINLLQNAVKYSPDGGTIALELVRQADRFTIKICDSGVGIAPEDLPFVFDWFYRGSHSTITPGSGLGLAIAKRCIDLHQGAISIQSQLKVGTQITIHLPALARGGFD